MNTSLKVSAFLPALLLLVACPAEEDSGDDGSGSGEVEGPLLVPEDVDLPGSYAEVTAMAFFPTGNDFLMLGKNGEVWQLAMDGDTVTEKGSTFIEGTHTDSDCGLISVAFDPDFATNQFIYLGRCTSPTESIIERYTWNSDDHSTIAATQTEIIRLGDAAATKPWHNVGAIGFDGEGVMWALFGDKKVRENSQDTSNNLGALIRINPNREPDGSGYTSVEGRPFEDSDVYAYGFRSPWTGVMDERGFFWVGDVGADDWEEVDVVTQAGQNFGWSLAEGPCDGECTGITEPLMSFRHGVDQYVVDDPDALPAHGRVVLIGVAYRENDNDQYDGLFNGRTLVGELCTGFARMVEVNDAGEKILDQHIGHIPHAHAWTQAPDGWIYTVKNGGCGAGSIGNETGALQRLRLRE